ncbi:MAG: phenylacetate--CoA ligase [Deltaproteobacteria bacterium]|nr:phenylacetate--CoA ligase [Deltaproteobacteria bacterium]
MLKRFPPKANNLAELEELQLKGLKWTVNHAFDNSSFFKERFAKAGVSPDDIKSLDDLKRLPFTTAADFRVGYPYPLLSVAQEDIVRIHASSGTTGKRKVVCYTQKDIDDWLDMFSRCYEMANLTRQDKVQICVGYGVWTAGAGFQLGCERFGAMAIPAGPGNLEMQMTFLEDFGTTVLCCTASMALLVAQEVKKRGLRDKLNLKKIIAGSERTSPAMKAKIMELLGVEEYYDIPGLTELYGPGTGLSCSASENIHYWADYYIVEILDPETLEPVAPGEVGEMVYTTLSKEAAPLIRYRSRDLTRLIEEPCPCGCFLPRHAPILGRSDDMFVIRGVNVYPSEIDTILSSCKAVGSEYQTILERKDDGKDYMIIKVERAEFADKDADETSSKWIYDQVRQKIMVTPIIEIIDYNELPRSERKTKRIFDNREI